MKKQRKTHVKYIYYKGKEKEGWKDPCYNKKSLLHL
jgi:hypothetical protein